MQYELCDLCSLRLVCNSLNDLIKHRVVGLVTLNGSLVKKLEGMAKGKNAFCELGHTLYLNRLKSDRGRVAYPPTVADRAIISQTKYLCKAIKTLKSVKTVQ